MSLLEKYCFQKSSEKIPCNVAVLIYIEVKKITDCLNTEYY